MRFGKPAAAGRFPAAAGSRRPAIRWPRVLAGVGLVVAFTAFSRLAWAAVAHGSRRVDPVEMEERAREALRAAREGNAGRRAPVNLAHAESAYAAGLTERRRQEHRMKILRDYRAARAELETAVFRAEAALSLSESTSRRDRAAAARSLAATEARLARLAGVEDDVWMSQPVRRNLQRARALGAEARSLLSAQAHTQAASRARDAEALARDVERSVLELTGRFRSPERVREWRAWAEETVAWSRRTGRLAVVVDKDAHRLRIYQGGQLVREYEAELGWNNVGDKRIQGDGATPEGRYTVVQKKDRGSSRYHRALLLDYPNREDRQAFDRLRQSGAIPAGARPGGLIEIHGEGGRARDWTDGCVALTNAQMDWLFARAGNGTPVTIVGSLDGAGDFSAVAGRLRP